MNHAQFIIDHSKPDQQSMNSTNNALKINKNSHFIKKSPSTSNSLSSSSSSSSLFNGVAAATSTTPRHPVIIYTHSPKVIRTHPRDFMALVQKLTGLSPEDDHSSPDSHPPLPDLPQQYHPKSEPVNDDHDHPVSRPESCLRNIIRPDHNINSNNNKKCQDQLFVNDDNESTSVVTDENNGSCSVGDAQVNSSASCYVPPPPIFDLGNLNDNKDINSGNSDYFDHLSDTPGLLDSNLNSTDLFFSDQPFCNFTDSLFFMPSMRSSISSSSSESIKELPDF